MSVKRLDAFYSFCDILQACNVGFFPVSYLATHTLYFIVSSKCFVAFYAKNVSSLISFRHNIANKLCNITGKTMIKHCETLSTSTCSRGFLCPNAGDIDISTKGSRIPDL